MVMAVVGIMVAVALSPMRIAAVERRHPCSGRGDAQRPGDSPGPRRYGATPASSSAATASAGRWWCRAPPRPRTLNGRYPRSRVTAQVAVAADIDTIAFGGSGWTSPFGHHHDHQPAGTGSR